jgi:glycosyltransferase involved in cell wall biosynthesis
VLRDVVVLGLARCFRARTVYHIRMGRLPQLVGTSRLEWLALYSALRLADKVMVIEQPSEMALKSVLSAEKLLRLPNAIDLASLAVGMGGPLAPRTSHLGNRQPATGNRQPATGNRQLIVLYLGWVLPTKGMRELMEAWRELKPEGWELVVAGPGSEEYRRELAGIATGGDSVRFLGEVSPAEGWWQMQRADVFVLPTYTEGFPNVILEAMAAGKAIVATNVGAIPEMLEANSTQCCGIIIEPRNVTVLAQALQRLMSDETLRLDMGRRARAKVERDYDSRQVFPELLGLWRKLAEASRE